MSNLGEQRKEKEERIYRLWSGPIARLAKLGITIELKYNKFFENYALHGSFVGRDGNDALLYSFMQELDIEDREDVDKIEYIGELLRSARALNLQSPIYIPEAWQAGGEDDN